MIKRIALVALTFLGSSGSFLTKESLIGFPLPGSRASLLHAHRDNHRDHAA
jgi:hypothetical protein